MGLPRGSVKQGRGGAVQRVAEGKNPGLMLAAAVCGCGGVLTIDWASSFRRCCALLLLHFHYCGEHQFYKLKTR